MSAFKAKNAFELVAIIDYPVIFNVLQFPAGIVPVTLVQPNEDADYTDNYNDMWTKAIKNDV